MTKLRLLREGAGCRDYMLLNSALRFSNLVFFLFILSLLYLFLFLLAAGTWRLVYTGRGESMIQGNARTIIASKGCAECILNFRISLLR